MPFSRDQQEWRIAVVIPARLRSRRLPRKPLADICGEAMIVHVWRAAMAGAEIVRENSGGCEVNVVVASDSAEIVDVIEEAGGTGMLTSKDHDSGTDRAFEAVMNIGSHHAITVNLQGDMPDFPPEGLWRVVDTLVENDEADIATLVGRIRSKQEAEDRNVVKAVLGKWRKGVAEVEDFTRAPAKWKGSAVVGPFYHHIGVYAYRRKALENFISIETSKREISEGLEQLRALDWGMEFCAAMLEEVPVGVDTAEDLERARERFLMKA